MTLEVGELMKRPYHVQFVHDTDGAGRDGWFAEVRELPGCMSQGDTMEEAAAMIQEAMAIWFADMLEQEQPIPGPDVEPSHSGRFQVRVPPQIHEALARLAAQQRVSLNMICATALARAVGQAEGGGKASQSTYPEAGVRGDAASGGDAPRTPSRIRRKDLSRSG